MQSVQQQQQVQQGLEKQQTSSWLPVLPSSNILRNCDKWYIKINDPIVSKANFAHTLTHIGFGSVFISHPSHWHQVSHQGKFLCMKGEVVLCDLWSQTNHPVFLRVWSYTWCHLMNKFSSWSWNPEEVLSSCQGFQLLSGEMWMCPMRTEASVS